MVRVQVASCNLFVGYTLSSIILYMSKGACMHACVMMYFSLTKGFQIYKWIAFPISNI